MFVTTIQGLFISIATILIAVAVAYKFKPSTIVTRLDKILFLAFQLAVSSSIWGTTAPKIGSAITVFRVAILVFWALYCWKLIKARENPLKGLSSYHWVLAAVMALMLTNGIITLLFFSPDASYTFSHLLNLCFDFLLCGAVFFYARLHGVIRSLMLGLTITLFGQMTTGIYECFAGPLYATTHLESIGPNFFGLMNLRLPSVSFMNTNDYTASLFFMGMPVIAYWLYRFMNGKDRKLSAAIIVAVLSGQWLVSYCGGGVLVQIGVIVFVGAIVVLAIGWAVKSKNASVLLMPFIPILFAVLLQVSPTVNLGVAFDSSWSSSQIEKGQIDGFSGLGTGTDETMERTTRYRTTLLKFSFETFSEHLFGAGMGNTQKLAESNSQLMKELGSRSKLHCYLAECMADYGLPFVALGSVSIILVLRRAIFALHSKGKAVGNASSRVLLVLLLASLPCAVLLSTAPSTAQDLKAMWIYLALWVVVFEWCTQGRSIVFTGIREDGVRNQKTLQVPQ